MFSNTKASADIFDNLAAYGQEKVLIEAVCLSTDTKPTDGIMNGSVCLEMDTGDVYFFDESGGSWIKLGEGGGGDEPEVWLVGDTGVEVQGIMQFVLSNVGDVNHMSELLANGENYKVYLNGDELPYSTGDSSGRDWSDSDVEESITKMLSVLDNSGIAVGVAYYVDASTAPESVEVSVKAK